MSSYGFLKGVMRAVTQLLFPFKLIGKEKIGAGACVLVGNHYRLWDITHMACTTKDRVHFIAKKELYGNRFLAFLCRKVEAIPVSRDGQDAKAIMTALRYLKNGEKISMFPEGTRNRTNEELLPLKGGAALFAIKARVPVYPVMCLHKTRLFRRTKIVVGDAVDLSAFYDRRMTAEDYAAAEEIIRGRMLATMHDYIAAQQARKQAKAVKKAAKKAAKKDAERPAGEAKGGTDGSGGDA